MKTILDHIVANPARGLRLSEPQRKQVAAFIDTLGWEPDLDTAIGVALGIAMMLNHRRGISRDQTITRATHVAREVAREWQRYG